MNPTWLKEPCPAWCRSDHREYDHPDDREHQSSMVEVPGVALKRTVINGTTLHRSESVTLTLARHRHIGSREQWIFIGTDEVGLDLSLETACRLRDALESLLHNHDRSR